MSDLGAIADRVQVETLRGEATDAAIAGQSCIAGQSWRRKSQ
jgi:hypothetical protein